MVMDMDKKLTGGKETVTDKPYILVRDEMKWRQLPCDRVDVKLPNGWRGRYDEKGWVLERAQPHELREIAREMEKPRSIYLIGSLRNPRVPVVASHLRSLGYDVFDDWYAAGPEADDIWQKYEQETRARSLPEALDGYHAQHTWSFDKHHLNRCQIGVLLMPCGKSGHLELGYLIGQGKPGFILVESGEPERWDVMYAFARAVTFTLPGLALALEELK